MGAGPSGGNGTPRATPVNADGRRILPDNVCRWFGACGGACIPGGDKPDIGSRSAGSDVVLHVYDVLDIDLVTTVNEMFRRIGTGVFHVGVEVYGWEWSYGHATSGTGLFVCVPASCRNARYRESVLVGHTALGGEEVMKLLRGLEQEWLGEQYDMLERNCTHFAQALCRRLVAKAQLPDFITSLPRLGASMKDSVNKASDFAKAATMVAAVSAGLRPRVRL